MKLLSALGIIALNVWAWCILFEWVEGPPAEWVAFFAITAFAACWQHGMRD